MLSFVAPIHQFKVDHGWTETWSYTEASLWLIKTDFLVIHCQFTDRDIVRQICKNNENQTLLSAFKMKEKSLKKVVYERKSDWSFLMLYR